jgi:hypothetical protein
MACGPNCVASHSEEYDTYYCETCNEWSESTCDDPTCEYCVNRPPTPLGVNMATRKKKTDSIVLDMPGTMGSAKLVFPKEPTVVKGNHLTVTTYPDGRTELVWDDAALLKEVQDAILSIEQAIKPAVKSTRKKKAENV